MHAEHERHYEPREKLNESDVLIAYDAKAKTIAELQSHLQLDFPTSEIHVGRSAFDLIQQAKSKLPAYLLTVHSGIKPNFWHISSRQIEMLAEEFNTPINEFEMQKLKEMKLRADMNFLRIPVLLRLLHYSGKICSITPEPPTFRKLETYLRELHINVTSKNFCMIDGYRPPLDNKVFYMEPYDVSPDLGKVWNTTLADDIHEAFKLAFTPKKTY